MSLDVYTFTTNEIKTKKTKNGYGVDTFGPSPRFESSLLVNVLLVSMPESLVAESWLPCRSESHRSQSSAAASGPSKRTVFFLRSVNLRLSAGSSSSRLPWPVVALPAPAMVAPPTQLLPTTIPLPPLPAQ